MKAAISLFITAATLIILAACGGGGGSSTSTPAPAAPANATAVLKIGTQGTLASGVSLYGVGIVVTLPAGVTVATDSNGAVKSSVAVVSGVASGGSIATPVYTPATATANATLRLIVAAAGSGFGTGEFVTVTCLLPTGVSLQASDFPATILSNLEPANQLLAPVTGLTPTITATLN